MKLALSDGPEIGPVGRLVSASNANRVGPSVTRGCCGMKVEENVGNSASSTDVGAAVIINGVPVVCSTDEELLGVAVAVFAMGMSV